MYHVSGAYLRQGVSFADAGANACSNSVANVGADTIADANAHSGTDHVAHFVADRSAYSGANARTNTEPYRGRNPEPDQDADNRSDTALAPMHER